MEVQSPKALCQTVTAQSATVAIIGTIILALVQTSGSIAQRHLPQHKDDIADILVFVNQIGLVMGLGGGIGAMAGHVTDKAPVYTARWLPGPNKEDLLTKYEAAKNTAAAIAQTPEIPQPPGVALTEISQPPAQAQETEVFIEIPIINE